MHEEDRTREDLRREIELLTVEKDFADHILSAAPLLIFRMEPDGTIMFINHGVATATEYTSRELIGENWFKVFFPGILFSQIPSFLKALELGQVTNYELDWKTRSGDIKTISWNTANRSHPDGRLSEIICIGTDVTQNRKNIEELRQSKARFEKLLQSVTNYIYTVKVRNGQAVETLHSINCEGLTGYTPEEYQQDPTLWLRMVPPEDQPMVIDLAKQALLGNNIGPIEHRIIRKNEDIRWIRNTLVIAKDAEGKVIEYEGLIVDITDRKKIEEEVLALNKGLEVRVAFRTAQLETAYQQLQEVTALQSAILNSATYMIISTDLNGRIKTFNDAAQKYLGYSDVEVIGKVSPNMFLLPSEIERKARDLADQLGLGSLNKNDALLAMARMGIPDEGHWHFCCRDGKTFPVQLSVVPLRENPSQVSGFLLIGSDITDQKKQDEVKAMNEARLKVILDLNLMTDASDLQLIQAAMEEGIRLTRSKLGFVCLLGEDASVVNLQTWSLGVLSECPAKDKTFPYRVHEQHLLSELIQNRKPIILNRSHSRFKLPKGHIPVSNFMAIPLLDAEKVVLILAIANKDEDYGEGEAAQLSLLLEDLWRLLQRRRLSSELARVRDQEMTIAAQIQQTLLMGQIPQKLPGVRISALSLPSQEVDGDFFDFFTYNKYCFDLLIGDVMGKGIPAALVGAAMKSKFLRALTRLISLSLPGQFPDPEEIVARVHSEMTPYLYRFDSFVSMHFARFDLKHREMHLINCGHTRVIHYRKENHACDIISRGNMPIGLNERENYRQMTVPIGHGDVFCFYSDGATDARNSRKEFFGIERLVHLVTENHAAKPAEIIRKIRVAISEFIGPEKLADDLTFVTVSCD